MVVLGFASGIGVDTRTAGASTGPQLTTAPAPPAPSTSTRPVVNYVAVPAPAQPTVVAPVVAAPVPSTTSAAAPSTMPQIVATTAAPATTTTAPTTTGAPTCSTGLLAGLVHALLDPVNGLLGLLDSLVGRTPLTGAGSSGPLDLSSLFGLLGSSAKQPSQPTSLLLAVTRLLPRVLPTVGANAPTASAALATSCTNDLSSTLPLLAGLG